MRTRHADRRASLNLRELLESTRMLLRVLTRATARYIAFWTSFM